MNSLLLRLLPSRRLDTLVSQPLLQGLGNKLGTLVTAQELGSGVLSDEDFQDSDDLAGH
jgi:hypothetical protein